MFLYKLVEGVAASSFGTHVANLAGVPASVVSRAAIVSADFARQFKARVADKRGRRAGANANEDDDVSNGSGGTAGPASSWLPIEAHADFTFLVRVARGEAALPQKRAVRREVLRCLRAAVPRYASVSASTAAVAA